MAAYQTHSNEKDERPAKEAVDGARRKIAGSTLGHLL
jgi:hypothetical protein